MDSYRTAVMEGVSCWLRPVDVGALIERPRAIDNRPYRFYRHILEFCNTPSSWVHVRCGHKKSRYPKGYLVFLVPATGLDYIMVLPPSRPAANDSPPDCHI